MKAALTVALAGLLGLSACASGGPKLDPATIKAQSDAFIAMGCKGTASLAVGGATAAGASPGSAHAEFSVSGACDPANAPRPLPAAPGPLAGP